MAGGVLVAITIIVAVFASGITFPTAETKKGKLTVLLIDAPAPLDQLNVTVTELAVHKVGDGDNDGEWKSLWEDEEGITFNLLYYQEGRTLELASAELDPGLYNKIRMYVPKANASYSEDSGHPTPLTPIPLKVPSNKTDVIVEFEIVEGANVIVTIDMEPDWIAISKSNNLRPVLKASVSEQPAPEGE